MPPDTGEACPATACRHAVLNWKVMQMANSSFAMMNKVWQNIVQYYKTIGAQYQVDPVIFVGIHVAATPLFLLAVWWIVYNRRHHKSILAPAITAAFVFNAANLYLVFFGRDLPWWIYAIVIATTSVSSYFSIKKIKGKLAKA